MTATPNEHGVYTDREELRLFTKKGAIPLCEVRVADTAEGFRATACFMFQTGNWLGSSGPITDRDPPFARREDAIAHAAGHLAEKLASAKNAVEPSMEGQRAQIVEWLTGLARGPDQLEMFAA